MHTFYSLSTILLIILATVPVGAQTVVTFPDANLEAAVRSALGIPSEPIYDTEMATLLQLTADSANISDISGIEYAVNLRELHLVNNRIADVTAISGLINLEYLYLRLNFIDDIGPLASLSNLRRLYLEYNRITNISPLGGLASLRDLSLYHNAISDITSLASLAGLQRLLLYGNNITDISGLASLSNLTELNLMGNSITDVGPLAGLIHLTTLVFDENNVSNIGSISALTNLSLLSADLNNITNISPLAALTKLQHLEISSNAIVDISVMSNLSQLATLYISTNSITDLSPLSGVSSLVVLDLRSNNINDVSALVANSGLGSGDMLDLTGNPLSQQALCEDIPVLEARGFGVLAYDGTCTKTAVTFADASLEAAVRHALGVPSGTIYDSDMVTLIDLIARSSNISNISGLEYAVNLQNLVLSDNNVSNLGPLTGLTGLQELVLSSNTISDLGALSGLVNLQYLVLDSNNISDISPLAALAGLRWLYLGSNTISDLRPLAGLSSLQTLYLWSNNINDLSPLAGLSNLYSLYLGSNSISNLSPLAGLTSLESLYSENNLLNDLSPLAGLNNLYQLYLASNSISEISALVANSGIGSGDSLVLTDNPLSQMALCQDVPVLESRGFASLIYDGTCEPPSLSVSPPTVSVGAVAGLIVINISNTGGGTLDWSAEITSGSAWLSVAPTSGADAGTITASYGANTAAAARTGVITVTAPGADGSPATVTITQAGAPGVGEPVVHIGAPSIAITTTGPVTYGISYENVDQVNLTPDKVQVNATGTASGSVSVSNGTSLSPTVTISDITGDGTIAFTILAGSGTNTGSQSSDQGAGPSQAFTVDNTPPQVSIGAPSVTTTSAGPVRYPITYTGASAVDLTAGDVNLIATGTAAGAVTVSNGTSSTPTVSIGGITGEGTLAIWIAAGTAQDEAGNVAGAAGPSEQVTVDPSEEPVAAFDDPQLEAAVREALGIEDGPVHLADLELLTSLYASGRGIESLGGLEQAVNLRYVNLSYNLLQSVDALLSIESMIGGARAELYGNPLSQETICDVLPELEARGVVVGFNGVCGEVLYGTISGHVTGTDSGGPAGCASVIIREGTRDVGVVLVGIDGYYFVPELIQGVTYTLQFTSPGFTPLELTHTLESEEDDVSVTLATGPSAILSGYVTDDTPEANPVAGALLVARQNGVEVGRTASCATGAFEFNSLDIGKATIIMIDVSAPGYVATTIEADISEPQVIEVTLKGVELTDSITGTVADSEGIPVSGATVTGQQTGAGFTREVSTGDDGGYSLGYVPRGDYLVRAVKAGMGSGTTYGAVPSQTTFDIEIFVDGTCIPPSPPTGVAASDGDPECVVVTWDAVGDGIEYCVYRCGTSNSAAATDISGWISATTFTDTTAAAPSTSGGCNGSTTTKSYYYWVMARNAGGGGCTSGLSASDTGYRGGDKMASTSAGAGTADLSTCLLVAVSLLLWSARRNEGVV